MLVTSADAFADYQQHGSPDLGTSGRWYALAWYMAHPQLTLTKLDAVRRTIMTTATARHCRLKCVKMREQWRIFGNKHVIV